MTPDAQRTAIAEACGWTKIERLGPTLGSRNYTGPDGTIHGNPPHGRDKEKSWLWNVPDYLTDLNAMHEAEKVLTYDQWFKYEEFLSDHAFFGGEHNHPWLGCISHCTAAQRAEAFLRTIGKWTE